MQKLRAQELLQYYYCTSPKFRGLIHYYYYYYYYYYFFFFFPSQHTLKNI